MRPIRSKRVGLFCVLDRMKLYRFDMFTMGYMKCLIKFRTQNGANAQWMKQAIALISKK